MLPPIFGWTSSSTTLHHPRLPALPDPCIQAPAYASQSRPMQCAVHIFRHVARPRAAGIQWPQVATSPQIRLASKASKSPRSSKSSLIRQRQTPAPKADVPAEESIGLDAYLRSLDAQAEGKPSAPKGLDGSESDTAKAKPTGIAQGLKNGRTLPFVLSMLLAGGIAFYSGQLIVAANQSCTDPTVSELSQQTDVASRYDYTADTFDSEVGLSEWLMGILDIRKEIASKCKGHVLEVSCGTGRNLGYFNVMKHGDVKSLTFLDLSPQMVDLCRKKWDVLYSRKEDKLVPGLQIRFLTASALEKMPLAPTQPEPKKYDYIIQTMGLCSTPSPVQLVENIARHLDTSNPDARIFLIEHGRSKYEWLNRILDNSAKKHAEIHGCWFNRDIGALVAKAAEQCGLEVISEKRRHLGTTWVYELRAKEAKTPVVDRSQPGWGLRDILSSAFSGSSPEPHQEAQVAVPATPKAP